MDYGIAVKAHMNHGNAGGIRILRQVPMGVKYKTTSEFSLCISSLNFMGQA